MLAGSDALLHTHVTSGRAALIDCVSAQLGDHSALVAPVLTAQLATEPDNVAGCVLAGPGWSAQASPSTRPATWPETANALPEGGCGLVLVAGVNGHSEPLSLLARAFNLLGDGQRCLVVDLFRRPVASLTVDALPIAKHFITQARRAGFELLETVELSTAVPPDRQALLIVLRRTTAPPWRILLSRETDYPALRNLFSASFGAEMDDAFWQWKYGGNRATGIVAWSDGEIVAHLGRFTRAVVWRGQRLQSLQYGDAMVRKDRRGSLVYRDISATSMETEAGYGRAHLIAFGWVFLRQSRLMSRWRVADPVTRMNEVTWPSQTASRTLWSKAQELQLPEDQTDVQALWRTMEAALGDVIVGIRNCDYLTYRYLQHPTLRYRMYVVRQRFTRRPIGLVVIKLEAERAVLVDLVGAPDRVPLLVSHARQLAFAAGKTQLSCWIDAAHTDLFARTKDATSHPLDVHVILNRWSDGPPEAANSAAWWLMMGDTDYL